MHLQLFLVAALVPPAAGGVSSADLFLGHAHKHRKSSAGSGSLWAKAQAKGCPLSGSIVCSRNNVMVLEEVNDAGWFTRHLQFGDECVTQSTAVCKNDRPCKGGCSTACPCDIDQSMGLSAPSMQTMFEEMGPWCSEKNSRVLMLGLGGGELPQHLLHHCSGMQVDAVELNGDVISFAREYFGLKESEQKFPGRLSIQQADALSAVKAKAENASYTYDVVLVDCFSGGGEVPESCRSREFSEKVKHVLKPSGVMLQNIWHYSSMNEKVQGEFEQAKSIYSEVFEGALDVVPVPMPPEIRWVDIFKATKTERSNWAPVIGYGPY